MSAAVAWKLFQVSWQLHLASCDALASEHVTGAHAIPSGFIRSIGESGCQIHDLARRMIGAPDSSEFAHIGQRGTAEFRTGAGEWTEIPFASVADVERARLLFLRAKSVPERKTGGEVPYGYRVGADGRTLEAFEPEQRVLAKVRELRAAGFSLRAVSKMLADAGLLARTGRPSDLK